MASVDARGLTCPAPVLRTREIIEKEAPGSIEVIVDNSAAVENVSRFLGSRGYAVSDTAEGDLFRVLGTLEGEVPLAAAKPAAAKAVEGEAKVLVLIMSDRMGTGDDELGRKLMINYIKTLNEMGPSLWQLIFVNGGVRLTCKDSPVLEEIKAYEKAGTTVLSCGTCMEFLGLTANKGVGGLTNMLDIVLATENADKVVTFS
jgi:selenium metabolism protein YedF